MSYPTFNIRCLRRTSGKGKAVGFVLLAARISLNRFHFFLLLFACQSSATLSWIIRPHPPPLSRPPPPPPPRIALGGVAHGFIDTLQENLSKSKTKQPTNRISHRYVWQVRWVKRKVFFSFKKEVKYICIYKTLCVWWLLLLWIEMYLFLYFALCQGLKFP